MKHLRYILTLPLLALLLWNCEGLNDNQEPDPIVTEDSSGITGQLTVMVWQKQGANYNMVNGATVQLFSNFDDIEAQLPLYNLTSASDGETYFGYVLSGNYYIKASATIGGKTFQDIEACQVLPQRNNIVDIHMLEQ